MIPLDERQSAQEQDWDRQGNDPEHGLPGHIGFRCYSCAYDSLVTVEVHEDSGDFWQSKQIAWQEECDVVMTAFDFAVADHFPLHQPANCQSCPVRPTLPIKPEPPWERR